MKTFKPNLLVLGMEGLMKRKKMFSLTFTNLMSLRRTGKNVQQSNPWKT